jgi:hypothetical protein
MGNITESTTIAMPIQNPFIDCMVSPAHINWMQYTVEDSLITTIHIVVNDGQNNLINNQQLFFAGNLGIPVDMETDNDNNPFTEITGIVPNQNGQLDKDWIFYIYECPPPVGNTPGTVTGTITIYIPGTDVEAEVNVTLYRYP